MISDKINGCCRGLSHSSDFGSHIFEVGIPNCDVLKMALCMLYVAFVRMLELIKFRWVMVGLVVEL